MSASLIQDCATHKNWIYKKYLTRFFFHFRMWTSYNIAHRMAPERKKNLARYFAVQNCTILNKVKWLAQTWIRWFLKGDNCTNLNKKSAQTWIRTCTNLNKLLFRFVQMDYFRYSRVCENGNGKKLIHGPLESNLWFSNWRFFGHFCNSDRSQNKGKWSLVKHEFEFLNHMYMIRSWSATP